MSVYMYMYVRVYMYGVVNINVKQAMAFWFVNIIFLTHSGPWMIERHVTFDRISRHFRLIRNF